MDELWQLSATALAAKIRQKEVSSEEVVNAHLKRISAVNDKVNAVTLALTESALDAARKADSSLALGPLHGVPFSVKENIDCIGSATTQGVPALADSLPPIDAPVVQRMKAAGAIPIARTNLPELGLRISTDNPLRGLTRNPWNRERTAGGSSGGEGAAIASGMSPIGLGNDIGGSVRNPAFCCGITSLKPSAGRIPHASSILPNTSGLAAQVMLVEGPMARHVSDLQVAYEVLSGRDIRDPVSVDAPLYGPPPLSKRVALVTQIPGVTLPRHHVDAINKAGKAMSDAGWYVEDVAAPELQRVTEVWGHILMADFEPMLDQFSMIMSDPAIKLLRGWAADFPSAKMTVGETHNERWRLSVIWSQFFADYPIVIGPTWTQDPFVHGTDFDLVTGTNSIDVLRFITPANLLGLPSVAVPTGVHEGLPTGVQVMADRWRDDLCLQGAKIVETALGQITPIDPTF